MSLHCVPLGSIAVATPDNVFDAVHLTIAGKLTMGHMAQAFCSELRGGGRFFGGAPFNKETAALGTGIILGFSCEREEKADAVHRITLSEGATNEGDPGPRPIYGASFYDADVRDFDENKMSFVYLSDGKA